MDSSLIAALELKRGLPYTQVLSELQEETVDVVKPIEGKDLRDIVTVLCSGLEYRLEQAAPSPLRTALLRAFNSMNIVDFGFNLNDTLVKQMLDAGVDAGLITENERLWFYGIATKQEPKYPSLSMRDVVMYFEPALLSDGEWEEINATGTLLSLLLIEDTPSLTLLNVEVSVKVGENWSNWKPTVSLVNIKEKGTYSIELPKVQREVKYRWVSPLYNLNGTVRIT